MRPNRLAGEELALNDRDKSIVSYADHAIAMVDEAEKGEHVGIEYMMPSLRARRALVFTKRMIAGASLLLRKTFIFAPTRRCGFPLERRLLQQASPVSHAATPPLLGGKLLGKLEDVCAVAHAVADHGNHVHGNARRLAGRGDLNLEAANLRPSRAASTRWMRSSSSLTG